MGGSHGPRSGVKRPGSIGAVQEDPEGELAAQASLRAEEVAQLRRAVCGMPGAGLPEEARGETGAAGAAGAASSGAASSGPVAAAGEEEPPEERRRRGLS